MASSRATTVAHAAWAPTMCLWITSNWPVVFGMPEDGSGEGGPAVSTPLKDKKRATSLRYLAALLHARLLSRFSVLAESKTQLEASEEATSAATAAAIEAVAADLLVTESALDMLWTGAISDFAAAVKASASSHAPLESTRGQISVAQLLRPPPLAMLPTLADAATTDSSGQFLRPLVHAQAAWLAQCEAHNTAAHEAVESLVLNAAASTTALDASIPFKRKKQLAELLARLNLCAANTNSADEQSSPQDEGMQPTLDGAGVAFCMASPIARAGQLLQAAIASAVAANPDALSPVAALSVVASLAFADRTQAFAFPSAAAGPARTLLVHLADVGFVFPIVADKQPMFIIHASLRTTLLQLPSMPEASAASARDATDISYFATATESDAPPPHRRHRTEENARAQALLKQQGVGDAMRALIALGRSDDINAISKHDLTTNASAATGGPWHDAADTVVTETNYRLYVYLRDAREDAEPCDGTPASVFAGLPHSSRTLLRLLDQFADRDLLVPRFAVYRLTRARFLAAVQRGVTQAQILNFLAARAHPSSAHARRETHDVDVKDASGGAFVGSTGAAAPPTLPRSIADQLALWEREARRVQIQPNVVLLQAPNSLVAARIVELLDTAPGWCESRAVVARQGLNIAIVRAAFDEILGPKLGTSV